MRVFEDLNHLLDPVSRISHPRRHLEGIVLVSDGLVIDIACPARRLCSIDEDSR